jgi:excisionase family DNA binding protein
VCNKHRQNGTNLAFPERFLGVSSTFFGFPKHLFQSAVIFERQILTRTIDNTQIRKRMQLNEQTLTIADAAALLRVHPETVRVAIRQHRLRARRFGKHSWMIEPADLDRYCREHRNTRFQELELI